jgi:hypothetical protein
MRYLNILHDAGVQYVFAGHLHQNSEGTDGSLTMITTGPVGKPLGTATSGMRVISVEERGLCSQYFGLGNLPNQIDAKAFDTCASSEKEGARATKE